MTFHVKFGFFLLALQSSAFANGVLNDWTRVSLDEGCDDLSAVPAFVEFNYLQIQSLFTANCAPCHINAGASGGINLDLANSMRNLLTPTSPTAPRVIPGSAATSLLFSKLNCEIPSTGSRMPLGGSPLSLPQQRYFQDWINAGAPIQKSGFE
jgi:hypothetical protein